MEEKSVTKRNEGIDLLKALCMVAVVGLHSQRSSILGTANNDGLGYWAGVAVRGVFGM